MSKSNNLEESSSFTGLDGSANDSDSDDDTLKIDCSTPKIPKKRKRKRKILPSPAAQEQPLDKTIQQTMQKFGNITPDAAKKMLLKLVKNEHVLALVTLQAEEENNLNESKSDSEDDDKESVDLTPKLTRLKAKQLKKRPLPIGPLNSSEPDEEVVKLIREEMKSDDEDDEYQPLDDEIQSDDDYTNTTMSDIESRPSTPGSSLAAFDNEQPSTSEALFKIPKQPLTAEEQQAQENISKRTRSKLCLTTTPIETIESTFVPPDITTDMYEFGQDNDAEWNEFLKDFLKPLDTNPEVDDDADPEYIAEANRPIDKEELREVRIPRKELNELISELLEMDGVVDEALIAENSLVMTQSANEPIAGTSGYKKSETLEYLQKPKRHKASSTVVSSTPKISESLETPIRDYDNNPRMDDETPIQTPDQTPNKSHDLIPFAASTPYQSELQMTPTIQMLQSPVTPQLVSTPVAPSNISPQEPFYIVPVPDQMFHAAASSSAVFVQNAQNQLELHQLPVSSNLGYNPLSLLNQAYYQNGVIHLPQFQPIVLQVPTVDLLQNKLDLSSVLVPPQQTQSNVETSVVSTTTTSTATTTMTKTTETTDSSANPDDPDSSTTSKPLSSSAKYKRAKLMKFHYLNSEPPPQEIIYSSDARGFTPYQKQIFDQQVRMHTQLLTQNFIQTYVHPDHWSYADKIKNNLEEMEAVIKPENSLFNAIHIKRSLEVVRKWEEELTEITPENKKFVKHYADQIAKEAVCTKKGSQFIGKFNPRIMETIVNSNVFIYPDLLPKIPFRRKPNQSVRGTEFPNSELSLIAFGLDLFNGILSDELNRFNPVKKRKPTITKVIEYVIRFLCPTRTFAGLRSSVDVYSKEELMNPIKYYSIHKRAPSYKHVIENIDLNNVLAPKDYKRGTLPYIWDKYLYSNDRIRRVYYNLNGTESEEDDAQFITINDDDEDCDLNIDNDENRINTSAESLQNSNQVSSSSSAANPIVINCVESEGNNYSIEVIYDQIPRINITDLTTSNLLFDTNVEIQDVTPPEHSPTVVNSSTSEKPLTSILKSSQSKSSSPRPKKSVSFDLPAIDKSRRLTRKRSFVIEKEVSEVAFQRKFVQIIQKFSTNYLEIVGFDRTKSLAVIRVYNWTRTIDIFTSFLKKRIVLTKYSTSRRMSTEKGETTVETTSSISQQTSAGSDEEVLRSVIDIKQEVFDQGSVVIIEGESQSKETEKPGENVTEAEKLMDPGGENGECSKNVHNRKENEPNGEAQKNGDSVEAGTSGTSSDPATNVKIKIKKVIKEEYSKRLSKKYEENFHLIVSKPPEDEYYLLEHDSAYAYNYFERVLKTFKDGGDDDLFDEFLNILKTFDPNFESVPELYHKMENLFMPKYSDLLDLFMTFMLPEHASDIGRFFEHFILTNMATLLEKLNYYFKQQPNHIKKIYAALNECANDPDITMEKLKQKIIPLLKSNRILIDWFTQLFEKDKGFDLIPGEHERVYYKNLMQMCDNNDSSSELDEVIPPEVIDSVVDVNSEKSPNSCGVKYVNGKIIYRDRIVLPAKLSFMAYNGVLDDSNVEAVDTLPDDGKEDYCVHEIRKHAKGYVEALKLKREKEDPSTVRFIEQEPLDIPDVSEIKVEVPDDSTASKKNKRKVIKKVKSKYKPCDSTIQHVHAIRLNPSVYARNGEKYSDVAHLLNPSTHCNGKSELNHDEKTSSPKKNNSKVASKKQNSPNIQKKKSPIVSSPTSSMSAPSFDSPSTSSRAFQTGRKLKNLLHEDSPTNRKKAKISHESGKRKLESESETTTDTDSSISSFMTTAKELFPKSGESESDASLTTGQGNGKSLDWTRDEDKVILEEIQKGLQRSNIGECLTGKLTTRKLNEIEERYDFLMNFLKLMKSK